MTIRSIQTIRLSLGVAVLGLLATAASAETISPDPAQGRHDAAYEAVRGRIALLEPGEAIHVGRLTVVPLRRDAEPTSTRVVGQPSLLDAHLITAEDGTHAVRLVNETSRPVFATAGRVLYGAGGEFVLAHDALVHAEGSLTVAAVPTFEGTEAPEASVALNWYPRLAPLLLKKELAVTGSRDRLDRLLASESDAESLRDLLSSDEGRTLDRTLAKVLHQPAFRDAEVVGFAAGIDGRLVALHAFGSPALHRSKAAKLLGSLGLYAEATGTRRAASRLRLLEGALARDAVVQATRSALHTLRAKSSLTFEDRTHLRLKAPGLIGFGSLHGINPIHLSVKPHDAKRDAVLAEEARSNEPS